MKKKVPLLIVSIAAIYFAVGGLTYNRWLIDFFNIPNTPTLDFFLYLILGLSGGYLIYDEVIK